MTNPPARDILFNKVDLALESVNGLIDQCNQAWQESRKLKFSEPYKNVSNIVFCGMGGSSLPAQLVASIFKCKIPFYINENYTLPSWANSTTLVILSSYSGNTEETISCAEEANQKGCMLVGITSGGKLHKLLSEADAPVYAFEPKNNSSNLPRFGMGYGIFGILGVLITLDLLRGYTEKQLGLEFVQAVENLSKALGTIDKGTRKFVLEDASDLFIIFSAEHLKGNGKAFTNQLNETSKLLSFNAELPEADHNLIEGFIRKQNSCITAIFMESHAYSPQVQKRFKITREIINTRGFNTRVITSGNGTPLQEMLETLYTTSLITVKLADRDRVDPLSIPNIENIKKVLTGL